MSPYVEGAKYVLEFKPGTGLDEPFKASSKLQVTVLKALYPFTISPVLKIKLDRSDWQETAIPVVGSTIILKLFDSRFAHDLREWHNVPDLTSALATEYREFSQRELPKPLKEWEAKRIQLENEDQELAPLEKEAHLDTLLRSYYQCETRVYGELKQLQRRGIPKFLVRRALLSTKRLSRASCWNTLRGTNLRSFLFNYSMNPSALLH